MIFICYPKCSTCQKAKKWLDEHAISYTERHIVKDNPSYDELKEWHRISGLPLKKFFNTSGLLYKEMKLALTDLSESYFFYTEDEFLASLDGDMSYAKYIQIFNVPIYIGIVK